MMLQDGIIQLRHTDFFLERRGDFQYTGEVSLNDNQVKLNDLFVEFGRQGLHQGVQVGRLATKGIGNHIGLTRMGSIPSIPSAATSSTWSSPFLGILPDPPNRSCLLLIFPIPPTSKPHLSFSDRLCARSRTDQGAAFAPVPECLLELNLARASNLFVVPSRNARPRLLSTPSSLPPRAFLTCPEATAVDLVSQVAAGDLIHQGVALIHQELPAVGSGRLRPVPLAPSPRDALAPPSPSSASCRPPCLCFVHATAALETRVPVVPALPFVETAPKSPPPLLSRALRPCFICIEQQVEHYAHSRASGGSGPPTSSAVRPPPRRSTSSASPPCFISATIRCHRPPPRLCRPAMFLEPRHSLVLCFGRQGHAPPLPRALTEHSASVASLLGCKLARSPDLPAWATAASQGPSQIRPALASPPNRAEAHGFGFVPEL
ncbi:uncharacterized protein [Aegilops tauschii subsp. strangulata]|uniref:uncharacterized protein n=1 Tax=Aegilops tauschii subsp. strangulata TaxID=200361 RepID=UPI001ABCE3EF